MSIYNEFINDNTLIKELVIDSKTPTKIIDKIYLKKEEFDIPKCIDIYKHPNLTHKYIYEEWTKEETKKNVRSIILKNPSLTKNDLLFLAKSLVSKNMHQRLVTEDLLALLIFHDNCDNKILTIANLPSITAHINGVLL